MTRAMTTGLCAGLFAALLLAAPAGAAAKARVNRQAQHGLRLTPPKHGLALSFVAVAPMHRSPAAVGIGVEYQRRLSTRWQMALGAELGFGGPDDVLQPYFGAHYAMVDAGRVRLHAGGGLAMPILLTERFVSTAIAARGVVGARWHWRVTSRVVPHAQAVILLGPTLTPHTTPSPYAAFQILVGGTFAI